MDFKERLRELREELGLTQKEVAEGSLLSPQCISQLEAGTRNPTGSTLISLANFFACSVDYLLCRTNDYEDFFHADHSFISHPLSFDELHLVEIFRDLSPDLQHRALTYVQNLLNLFKEEKSISK